MGFMEQLNYFYKNLDDRAKQIRNILIKNSYKAHKNYYNGHYYNKDASGNYVMDYYPIPVVEVEGLCDIEVVASHINISSKLTLKDAISFNYDTISDYYYEVYGVKDYLADYYKSGDDLIKLYKNLEICNETEIGFAFSFDNSTPAEKILEIIIILKNNGFYY